MQPEVFFAELASWASWAHQETGVLSSVILAQWAIETAYGSSSAWVFGHNPAGISPGGEIASYPDVAAGMAAWVETMRLPAYAGVRAPGTSSHQAVALGYSPWAASHYGTPPGELLEAVIADWNLTRYDAPPPPPPAPRPLPPPTNPVRFEVPNVNIQRQQVQVSTDANGDGWTTSPQPIASVLSVLPVTVDPEQIHHYSQVPEFAGITVDGKLVFTGGTPNVGSPGFGFVVWSVVGD